MGIDGVDSLTGNDDAPKTERPTDKELEEKREAELAAARDEHNRRVGGGNYPQKHEEHRQAATKI